jgi:TusA-related sulfurtransferase
MGLHTTQDFVGDNVVVYSATIDDEVKKFTVNFENRRNTFSETIFLDGSDITKTYTGNTEYTSVQQGTGMISPQSEILTPQQSDTIPQWIKNNAEWWADDIIDDDTFVNGIEFLIKEKILNVTSSTVESSSNAIPQWVKNNAGWWADDIISEDDFISGIEYLVNNGIISVS